MCTKQIYLYAFLGWRKPPSLSQMGGKLGRKYLYSPRRARRSYTITFDAGVTENRVCNEIDSFKFHKACLTGFLWGGNRLWRINANGSPSIHPSAIKRSFIRGGVANRLWHTPQANTRNPHQPQNVCSRATSVPEQNGWWNMIMCGESSFSSIEFVKISMARQWEAFIMELPSGLANHNASEWSVSGSTKTSLVQMKLIFDFILTKCWASVCLFVIWLRKEGWKEARSRGCERL